MYPGENKPIFAGNATTDIACAWPHLWGRYAVTTRGWAGQRSRPRRGRTCPKARLGAAVEWRCGAGIEGREPSLLCLVEMVPAQRTRVANTGVGYVGVWKIWGTRIEAGWLVTL